MRKYECWSPTTLGHTRADAQLILALDHESAAEDYHNENFGRFDYIEWLEVCVSLPGSDEVETYDVECRAEPAFYAHRKIR